MLEWRINLLGQRIPAVLDRSLPLAHAIAGFTRTLLRLLLDEENMLLSAVICDRASTRPEILRSYDDLVVAKIARAVDELLHLPPELARPSRTATTSEGRKFADLLSAIASPTRIAVNAPTLQQMVEPAAVAITKTFLADEVAERRMPAHGRDYREV